MSKILKENPELILKLVATSMGLSFAVVKLSAYKRALAEETTSDVKYYQDLKTFYTLYSEEDLAISESLMAVSSEADKLEME